MTPEDFLEYFENRLEEVKSLPFTAYNLGRRAEVEKAIEDIKETIYQLKG